jgi:hypothetical protein
MDCLIPALRACYDSPSHMMRSLYKYTDCGASGGLLVEGTVHVASSTDPYAEAGGRQWLYGSDAGSLGSWDEMEAAGFCVLAVCVSSIVEGIDATTSTIEVHAEDCADVEDFDRRWDAAVESVEQEARDLWNESHGCAWCNTHDVPENADPYEGPSDLGGTINPTCPACDGDGICL